MKTILVSRSRTADYLAELANDLVDSIQLSRVKGQYLSAPPTLGQFGLLYFRLSDCTSYPVLRAQYLPSNGEIWATGHSYQLHRLWSSIFILQHCLLHHYDVSNFTPLKLHQKRMCGGDSFIVIVGGWCQCSYLILNFALLTW